MKLTTKIMVGSLILNLILMGVIAYAAYLRGGYIDKLDSASSTISDLKLGNAELYNKHQAYIKTARDRIGELEDIEGELRNSNTGLRERIGELEGIITTIGELSSELGDTTWELEDLNRRAGDILSEMERRIREENIDNGETP